mgnify:CR=1 FL=1
MAKKTNNEDDELERLLDDFALGYPDDTDYTESSESEDEDESETEESTESESSSGCPYAFHAIFDDKIAQTSFSGLPQSWDLTDYYESVINDDFKPLYLHVDVEIPEEDDADLRIVVNTDYGMYEKVFLYDSSDIELYRDFNRLHLDSIKIDDLIDDHCKEHPKRPLTLSLTLYRDNDECLIKTIKIDGVPLQELDSLLAEIENFYGWDSFKQHVRRMVSSYNMIISRKKYSLKAAAPNLNTIIVGNTGTGKTTAANYLAKLYKAMGYLKSAYVSITPISDLTSTININGEAEATKSALNSAEGRALILENAHLLHNHDNKNYNPEDKVISAIVDYLNNTTPGNMMVALVGYPSGITTVLASRPELRKHFPEPIVLEDFKPKELCQIAQSYCSNNDLELSDEARKKLETYILHKYNLRGPDFENAWFVQRLFDDQIVPKMSERLSRVDSFSRDQLVTILPEDIPSIQGRDNSAMEELEGLVGLEKIKTRVKGYLNAVRLASLRMEKGMTTHLPRLHMAFLGNPGTGKTTVATIIGKVFASWGILSGGRVIQTEKSKMVGQYIGETELKMRELIAQARGNILFIDEAYQLVEGGEKDYGRIVMNSLLTELGKDNQDMVVILAGYTAPMKKLIDSNEGIESRFPNVFNFDDYSTDELMKIGQLMIRKQGFVLTEGAEANMRAIIQEESEKPSPRFGNGRFVSNLLQNEIFASLGTRVSAIKNPTADDICTILPEDVVIGKAQKEIVFDDDVIDAALERLDNLTGLTNVKKAIHNFVKSARYLHSIGEPYVGKGLLSWRFVGNSGTGKSTVAEIMATILKGMRLISNSHITEIKGERIFNASEMDCDQVLKETVKKSCNGLIFIDADTRGLISDPYLNYARTVERIRLKIGELTVETGGECALILAELDAPNKKVAEQLSEAGIYEFDHTLMFKDFTAEELYNILCNCLKKHNVSFSPAAEKHMMENLSSMRPSVGVNARTMKLMSRAIYQQVILRESNLTRRPKAHIVQLSDIGTFKWNGRKDRIGF